MTDQTAKSSQIDDIVNGDIIALLGLEKLPEDKQEEYRDRAAETIYNRAFNRLTDTLDEMGKMAEFEAVIDDEEKTRLFLSQNGIDLDQVMLEETMLYKSQMKNVADVLNAGINISANSK